MAVFSLQLITQNTKMISPRKKDKPHQWAQYLGAPSPRGRGRGWNFDIACLQEAFTNRAVRRLVDRFSRKPEVHEKNKGTKIPSSGLANLVWAGSINRKRWTRYNRQAGIDRWAKKGAILTEIDLGPGRGELQVYNTHLNAAHSRNRNTYEEARLVTIRQCFELGKFIVASRRAHIPAIVCGDFNLDGENRTRIPIAHILSDERRRGLPERFWNGVNRRQGPLLRRSLTNAVPRNYSTSRRFGSPVSTKTQYQLLVDMFRVLGFTDAWGEDNRNRCYTTKLGRRDEEDGGRGEEDFRTRMPIIARPDPDNSLFALDSTDFAPGAKRLDYLFFSPGNGRGPTTMSVSTVRRTYIPRPGQDSDLPATEKKWLSDHVGLACRLVFG